MNKPANVIENERRICTQWLKNLPWWRRIVVQLFRKQFKSFAFHLLSRGHEFSYLDSYRLHALDGIADRMLKGGGE